MGEESVADLVPDPGDSRNILVVHRRSQDSQVRIHVCPDVFGISVEEGGIGEAKVPDRGFAKLAAIPWKGHPIPTCPTELDVVERVLGTGRVKDQRNLLTWRVFLWNQGDASGKYGEPISLVACVAGWAGEEEIAWRPCQPPVAFIALRGASPGSQLRTVVLHRSGRSRVPVLTVAALPVLGLIERPLSDLVAFQVGGHRWLSNGYLRPDPG